MLLMLFMRDVVKLCRGFVHSLLARLFHVERMSKTWIHCTARLDILPVHKKHEHALNRFVMNRGAYVEARSTVNTWHGDVVLGEGSGIGIGTIIIGPVDVGANVAIAQNCFVSGINHEFKNGLQSFLETYSTKKVVIGDSVWIGANCVILPGITIGSNSVIGAGSVVVKSIPPNSVAVGNPARVVKSYDVKEGQWLKV